MIEETAIVARIDAQTVWVDSRRSGSCGGCRQQNACATSLLDKLIRPRLIQVDCALELQPGEAVIIGIEEHSLLSASFVQYGLPLVFMLLGAGVADQLLQVEQALRDLLIAGVALASLAASLALISRWQRGFLQAYLGRPVVLRKA
ncbi:MAG: SoxR reducing system RseC family protein [Methylococcales bacterium]|nr:SoxR reducing system RseC family protein [Methylococcales bacterium]